jgi:ABC-type oligopeptide transport system substrate-binding subunit
MWKTALNIDTEIVIRNWDEYEAGIRTGDYDVVRRGMVMQTTDELTNLRVIFDSSTSTVSLLQSGPPDPSKPQSLNPGEVLMPDVESEEQALKELKVMPIYFASSYAMVKPYVSSFDANILDAPSLKRTRVDTTWVEKKP